MTKRNRRSGKKSDVERYGRRAVKAAPAQQPAAAPVPQRRIGPLEVIAILSVLFFVTAYLWPRHTAYADPIHRLDCYHRMQKTVAATLHYAMTHGGTYPTDLKNCPEIRALRFRDLICPASEIESEPHPGLAGPALDAGQPISYTYVGDGVTNTTSADTVVWLEPDTDHRGFGLNVAFADGHMEWLTPIDAQEILAKVSMGIRPVKAASAATTQPDF